MQAKDRQLIPSDRANKTLKKLLKGTVAELFEALPDLRQSIEDQIHANTIWGQITSFDDVDHKFILGHGYATSTQRNMRIAYKQFYEFTDHKHPREVKAADIEMFFDHKIQNGLSPKTAFRYIQHIEAIFNGMVLAIPMFVSPFHESRMD